MKKVRSKLCPTEIGVIKTFSLSPDDEVGEIAVQCSGCTYYYNNLSELCEKWEDYEEPKGYWMITSLGEVICPYDAGLVPKGSKEIGNYFSSKEEAEKAAEKLKAWKRLNNCGLKFIDWWLSKDNHIIIGTNRQIFDIDEQGLREDLNLLFGGEE